MTEYSPELFNASLSALYHRRRASFLASVTRLLSLLTILLGTGAFAALSSGHAWIASTAAVIVTLIGAVQIVYAPETAAACHRRWYGDWLEIERDLRGEPDDATMADCARRKLAIEREYPDQLNALYADCYNRTAALFRLKDDVYPVRWFMRPLIQVCSFENSLLSASARLRKAEEAEAAEQVEAA